MEKGDRKEVIEEDRGWGYRERREKWGRQRERDGEGWEGRWREGEKDKKRGKWERE